MLVFCYDEWMFYKIASLFCLGLLSLPVLVLASTPIINNPLIPYEILAIDANLEQEQLYLGELVGDPHMYEVTLAGQKPLIVTILQRADGIEPLALNLIVVRSNDNNRGVTEIGRVKGKEVIWQPFYDPVLGFKFWRSEAVSFDLQSGVYRFEVSTADNQGKYMLAIGNNPAESGYFTKLGEIRLVQNFFDVSVLHLLLSTYILYPLGIIILLVLFWLTWRYQRKKDHA